MSSTRCPCSQSVLMGIPQVAKSNQNRQSMQ